MDSVVVHDDMSGESYTKAVSLYLENHYSSVFISSLILIPEPNVARWITCYNRIENEMGIYMFDSESTCTNENAEKWLCQTCMKPLQSRARELFVLQKVTNVVELKKKLHCNQTHLELVCHHLQDYSSGLFLTTARSRFLCEQTKSEIKILYFEHNKSISEISIMYKLSTHVVRRLVNGYVSKLCIM